ncbi:MAG: hypothetical protein KF870_14945 [Leadbetterella sp.]|nr:hypothetical protein [Leadbetterella sp.]
MKKLFNLLFVGAMISCAQSNAQSSKEHISKEIALSSAANQTVVEVYNLLGSIRVEGYSGNVVLLEIDKTVSAKNKADIDLGNKEFELGIDTKQDTIVIYTRAPYDTRPSGSKKKEKNNDNHYSIKLDYVIKVPQNVSLRLSTINDGLIEVSQVSGRLKVNNINGGIQVNNAKGQTDLHTINGGIDVSYTGSPVSGSSCYALNGTINAVYPENLSADLKLKSMNGNFFTDFPNAEIAPQTVVKKNASESGTTYKLNKDTHLKIGKGENQMNFETLNGNIYIKKRS